MNPLHNPDGNGHQQSLSQVEDALTRRKPASLCTDRACAGQWYLLAGCWKATPARPRGRQALLLCTPTAAHYRRRPTDHRTLCTGAASLLLPTTDTFSQCTLGIILSTVGQAVLSTSNCTQRGRVDLDLDGYTGGKSPCLGGKLSGEPSAAAATWN